MPASWTHKDLYEAFKSCGTIVSARVSIKDDYTSRGFGFIAFSKKNEADAACEQVSDTLNSILDGRQTSRP